MNELWDPGMIISQMVFESFVFGDSCDIQLAKSTMLKALGEIQIQATSCYLGSTECEVFLLLLVSLINSNTGCFLFLFNSKGSHILAKHLLKTCIFLKLK